MLSDLWIRLRSLFRRNAVENELDAELGFHFDQQVEKLIQSGLPLAEARRRARLTIGGSDQIKEECREARGIHLLETLAQDIRYAIRMLRKSPGFTAVAVLTLALGIGANTTIFSVVDGVILKPLPYDDPNRLVRIYQSDPSHGLMRMMDSAVDIDTARRQNSVFGDIAYYQESDATLTGVDEPEQIAIAYVSPGFFTVLGERPLAGRSFLPEEHQPGRDQIVILSYSLWHRLFNNAADAVGQKIRLDGKPYMVVGVMPVGFQFPQSEPPITMSVWLPWSETSEQEGRNREVAAIARLKVGASVRQAQAQMDAISTRLASVYPDDAGWKFDVVPLQNALLGDTRLAILIIFAAVGFVLLIACANLASLLVGRAATREKEMAIRAAIGASRSRIIRQLLTESMLLALAGGTVGLAIAAGAIRVLRAAAPKDIPRLLQVHLSNSVLAFTVAVSVAIGILFGLVPALRASRPSLGSGFNEPFSPSPAAPGARRRAQRILPVFQVALSLVLLIGAGLMARSFLRLTSVALGFQPRNLLTFGIDLSSARYGLPASRLAFYQQTLERIEAVPGVESAAIANTLALTGGIGVFAAVEGHHYPPMGEVNSKYESVSPDYFGAMHIPLFAGRLFTDADSADSPFVAIVNQAFVRQNFPNEIPLGKRIRISTAGSSWRPIVGVVGDVREDGIGKEPSPEAYVLFVQTWITQSCAYVVRTHVAPLSLVQPIRRAILAVDKNQPITLVQTMDQILSDESAPPRFRGRLLGLFSLLALVLTAVGLYGIMAYSVVQRTHEIGVRMALGAQPRDISRMVLGEGLLLAIIGIAAGICGALALTRFLASLLFEIKPTDPTTFIGVAILLLSVALAACYIPARRAMRVDPMVALRYE